MPVKFTVSAEIIEDGSYQCSAASADGSPVLLLDVLSFFNRASTDVIGQMAATVADPAPEPPSEG